LGEKEAVEDDREQKELLRRTLRAERSALGVADVRAASEACCRHVAPLLGAARMVAVYSGARGEIDPAPLLPELRARGVEVAWPRVADERSIYFHTADGLEPGRFQLQEPPAGSPRVAPDDIDVMLVPGVAYDDHGHRLGQGRGYYDRYLEQAPRALRLGLCHAFQLVAAVPHRTGDQPVDYIVTPDGARKTGARALKETP
jgi:5-formyltetrahydrofolate cyclo-ligase